MLLLLFTAAIQAHRLRKARPFFFLHIILACVYILYKKEGGEKKGG